MTELQIDEIVLIWTIRGAHSSVIASTVVNRSRLYIKKVKLFRYKPDVALGVPGG
jgi:hypothetical protein